MFPLNPPLLMTHYDLAILASNQLWSVSLARLERSQLSLWEQKRTCITLKQTHVSLLIAFRCEQWLPLGFRMLCLLFSFDAGFLPLSFDFDFSSVYFSTYQYISLIFVQLWLQVCVLLDYFSFFVYICLFQTLTEVKGAFHRPENASCQRNNKIILYWGIFQIGVIKLVCKYYSTTSKL